MKAGSLGDDSNDAVLGVDNRTCRNIVLDIKEIL